MTKIHCVVGGQFGSEAKGAVAAFLSKEIQGSVVGVRVGGPNAGHTVLGRCPSECGDRENGDHSLEAANHPWRLRQVPVLAVSRLDAELIIAQGSEVDIEVLHAEVEALDSAGYGVSGRLTVDMNATVIIPDHKLREAQNKLNYRLGSTAKGIGAARADRIMRTAPRVADYVHTSPPEDDAQSWIPEAWLSNSVAYLDGLMARGHQIIVEGTQGYGLGLHTRFYPYTTSGDCRTVDLLAQTGINPFAPHYEVHTWLVIRPNPIRVAGNSGPLHNETTWAELGLPNEYTTVTQKVRRVGGWDPDLVNEAIQANGGVSERLHVVLTMLDHLVPSIVGATQIANLAEHTITSARKAVAELDSTITAPIELVGTGPNSMMWYRGPGLNAVRPDGFAQLRMAAQRAIDQMKVGMERAGLGPVPTSVEGRIESTDELTDWWLERAQAEVKPMVDKALEYGGKGAAIDLIEIGRDLARIAGKTDVSDEEATELGIYFYLRGKFGRWQAAVLEGRRVSDDTLLDIGVYVRMAQRNRAVGGWPYAPEEVR